MDFLSVYPQLAVFFLVLFIGSCSGLLNYHLVCVYPIITIIRGIKLQYFKWTGRLDPISAEYTPPMHTQGSGWTSASKTATQPNQHFQMTAMNPSMGSMMAVMAVPMVQPMTYMTPEVSYNERPQEPFTPRLG